MKNVFILILGLLLPLVAAKAETIDGIIEKETLIYSIKGTDTLRLDKYSLPSISEPRPCIIFMFGGGFVSGQRDSKGYTDYFNHLAKNEFIVISIDYRLGMKNIGSKNIGNNPMEFVSLLNNSITVAVEDLYDATNYLIVNSDQLNIAKDLIILSGSSAGAISVLHGEYDVCNKTELASKLPEDFQYAGTIAFAGAIFSTNGAIKWQQQPCPIQLFHGDADSNVPYDKIELLNFGFYGSQYIANQLDEMDSPYYFCNFINADHRISHSPMVENLDEIDSFLHKLLKKKESLKINQEIKTIGKPKMKKDFELMDYIKSNWAGN